MTNSPFIQSLAADAAPGLEVTHEAITLRARELWEELGCPENCDESIWLEAEAEIRAIQQGRYRHPNLQIKNLARSQPPKELHCV